ncbi:hypothetical protein SSP35_06_02160 [Streptomyces sp. NBRC 110611]|uniref:CGNR zinc finger domain-containing protein n=1 Tax=Streptomyces sp. NBRC 110611 TaxID=1621259 RepID=UPI000858F01A|nr:CGNR zinc finger domain-containing protein [Streptomyces sp. NBRC 110611]GAU68128.1 hypothetical protein SSP35_06_02160 [Streptomyces sp. NBRC 110611]
MSRQGFQPAQRLVDLANALRDDPGLPRADLMHLLARHGEDQDDLTGAAFSDDDAQALRGAVIRMSGILAETDTERAALALNALLAEHAAVPRLSRHGGHPWHLHVDRGDNATWDNWFLAAGALALAQILTEHGRVPWGECAAPRCRRFYLGTGPGSPRRYCSSTCASRARVAAHRRRKQTQPPPPGTPAQGPRAAHSR